MVAPKIIFRDVSLQHIECLLPIYRKMVNQGFNCETQYVNIPKKINIEKLIKKHEDDEFDLLVTTTGGRDVYYSYRRFRKYKGEEKKKIKLDYLKTRRAKSIYCIHGVGSAEKPNEIHHQFKAVFLAGLININKFKKSGLSNLHLIGYPKLDVLFAPHSVKTKLMEKAMAEVGKLPFLKTVLYAPSIKRFDSFDDSIMHLLKIFKKLNVNLLIKPHCGDLDKTNPLKLLNEAKTYALNMTNVKWINNSYGISIVSLYLISDVLVSGASSCLREFMLIDKPSIQLTNVNTKRFFYDGCVHSDLSDLKDNILKAANNPEWLREERQKQINKCFYKPDGHAADRAVKRIKEIMGW